MRLLSARETHSHLDGLVHFDTQAPTETGLDLTAAGVFAFTGRGQIDFGGSEAHAAERQRLDPQKDDPTDDYGWWSLEAGTYAVDYNESVELDRGEAALIVPHERLLATGAHHPAFWLQAPREAGGPLEAVLSVGGPGMRIKENARLSTLLLFGKGA